jgi:hypothetical protein
VVDLAKSSKRARRVGLTREREDIGGNGRPRDAIAPAMYLTRKMDMGVRAERLRETSKLPSRAHMHVTAGVGNVEHTHLSRRLC